MIKAVLLDLDDTLLHVDTDAFVARYLGGLNGIVQRDYPAFGQGPFGKAMAQAVRAIAENVDPTRTNAEIFSQTVATKIDLTPDALLRTFDEYHGNGYGDLRSMATPIEAAAALIDHLAGLDIRVVIATNPVFRLDVIRDRLAWAALESPRVPYALITDIDEMHFSKPQPHYYEEILARMGVEADEAIMVGDSLSNDMIPAAKAGLNTFWIDWDNVLPADVMPDGHGTLADFDRLVGEGWLSALEPRPRTAAQVIPRMIGNVGALYGLIPSLNPAYWDLHPDPKEWSPLEIVCHLRDSERNVQRPRLQRILAEDNPFISPPPPPPGPRARDLSGENGKAAVDEFWRERRETIKFIEGLRPEDWQRPARHSIFGPTTLLEMAHFTTRHDHLHISQLCETLGHCRPESRQQR